ncbi:MAG TPA: TPM domain-containing protein [Cyclobacteriaceae bacterium]|nr:TPM domain-containing protein [Cyclobacteriaceae bacterium]
MRSLCLTAFLLSTIFVFGQSVQYTPESVPNTKLVNNSYVSNPDNIVLQTTVDNINLVLGELEAQTTAQVAVVMIESIGDESVEDFAQELFQLWGIGRANNNGLLILLVKDQRKVRFHTGYGLEGPLPDAICNRIQRVSMVPAFRDGDYDTGMYSGVVEVQKVLTDPAYREEITSYETASSSEDYMGFAIFFLAFFTATFLIVWASKDGTFADSKEPDPSDFKQMRLRRRVWLIMFGLVPVLIVLFFWFRPGGDGPWNAIVTIYFYFMATIFYRLWRERKMIKGFVAKEKYFQITEYMRKSQWYWLFIAIVFPVPFAAYFPIHFVRKKFYRNHPRKCKLCNKDMIKLSEIEEDQYLSSNQQLEETIRSVDHDVWKCTECAATERWAFANKFSKYKTCSKCKTVAYYLESDRTLVSATYSSEGKGEKIYKCKACKHSYREKYTIAQKTSSSDSSSGSGGSSSSSSGGGSWGGGSSGGGGSTSSW